MHATWLTDVAEAVESARAAGLEVRLELGGVAGDVADAVGRTLALIVRDALEAAVVHAPESRTTVSLDTSGPRAVLEVGSAGALGGQMSGASSEERLRAAVGRLGGEVFAGAVDNGWLVRATIPRRHSTGFELRPQSTKRAEGP